MGSPHISAKDQKELPPPVHKFFFEYHLIHSLKRLNVVYIKGDGDDSKMETSFTIQGRLSVNDLESQTSLLPSLLKLMESGSP